jgi:hypothetical protein
MDTLSNQYALAALKDRRATIAGEMSALQDRLRYLKQMAEAVDHTIRLQKRFGEMQTRAYVGVLINTATFQERDKNLRFRATPALINSGMTPARGLKYQIRAAILPVPLPGDFKFKLPPKQSGQSILQPRQNGTISAEVEDFVPDNDVRDIKRCNGQALYTWGLVTYKDIFSKTRRVTFCHQMTWIPTEPEETVRGTYLGKHNRTS